MLPSLGTCYVVMGLRQLYEPAVCGYTTAAAIRASCMCIVGLRPMKHIQLPIRASCMCIVAPNLMPLVRIIQSDDACSVWLFCFTVIGPHNMV
jgi:hypothetical protein